MGGNKMSMDYIPLGVDYTKSRAERRRNEKEAIRSIYKGERKLNPSQHPLNRQHRRHPTHEDKLVMWKEDK
jgi:hypothetical protein